MEQLLRFLFFFIKPTAENHSRAAFDAIVALVCTVSLLLCGRSILRGIILEQVQCMLFHSHSYICDQTIN